MRSPRDYVAYVIIMAPLLNSVSGIAIDLFAPSMPAIARQFGVSDGVLQGSISITLIAYALGQLFFGLLADGRGRLAALLPGLGLFVAGSLLAMLAQNIETFLLARALQGFAVGACQVCARALLVDNVKGERFFVAVVYLSLAWGLGPVLAPFIGALVEEYLGWRWNFALYALYSTALLLFSLRLRESLPIAARKTLRQSLGGYRIILGNGRFLSATLALGTSLSMFLIWNIIGPFIAQLQQRSPTWFGATALAAGLAYLLATLLNRVLIKRCSAKALMSGGLLIGGLGIAVMLIQPTGIGIPTLLTGVLLSNFGQGLLFSNVVAFTMTLYPDRAGATASLLGCGMMICAGLSSALTGHLSITSNTLVALLFGALLGLQGLGVCIVLRPRRAREIDHERHAIH
ncbi:MFS transporter [Pseudomonas sp. MWU16-30317]|uniref:MFS transporter n=1 Tax=Pseudomonas sp. MWU16-30317 TaxID=2878095 RepID=UPI001CFBA0AA